MLISSLVPRLPNLLIQHTEEIREPGDEACLAYFCHCCCICQGYSTVHIRLSVVLNVVLGNDGFVICGFLYKSFVLRRDCVNILCLST